MEATELRLVKLAQRIADMYQDDMEPQYYRQLCNAITVCREYYVHSKERRVGGSFYGGQFYLELRKGDV